MWKILVAVVATLGVLGYFILRPGEGPDISESKARAIAEKALEETCREEQLKCTDYYFKGQETPADDRFVWGFKYISEFTDPRTRIFVAVSKKGEVSTEFAELPPPSAEEAPVQAGEAGAN